MKEIDAELPGNQRMTAKKICGPKLIRRLFNFYKKLFCPRNIQVNNLNIYLNLTIEEDKIAEVRFGDVSEVSFRSPGNQIVQEQHNYGGLKHGE